MTDLIQRIEAAKEPSVDCDRCGGSGTTWTKDNWPRACRKCGGTGAILRAERKDDE